MADLRGSGLAGAGIAQGTSHAASALEPRPPRCERPANEPKHTFT